MGYNDKWELFSEKYKNLCTGQTTEENGGNYYDTGSAYTHYDSSEAMNQKAPKKKRERKAGGFGRTVAKCLVLALVFGSVSSAAQNYEEIRLRYIFPFLQN